MFHIRVPFLIRRSKGIKRKTAMIGVN